MMSDFGVTGSAWDNDCFEGNDAGAVGVVAARCGSPGTAVACTSPRGSVGRPVPGRPALGPERRKAGWMRAEAAGGPGPWRQQAILGRGRWDALRDVVRDHAMEILIAQSLDYGKVSQIVFAQSGSRLSLILVTWRLAH